MTDPSQLSKLETAPKITEAEIQSGLDRQLWAENLIKQLPRDHDGRNSWLINYGRGLEAIGLRTARDLKFNEESQAVNPPFIPVQGQCSLTVVERQQVAYWRRWVQDGTLLTHANTAIEPLLRIIDRLVAPQERDATAAKLDSSLAETLTDNVVYIRSIRDAAFEECAQIALAIDSNRGNEKEIAKAIRNKKGLPPILYQEASGPSLDELAQGMILAAGDIDYVSANARYAIATAILAKYDVRAKR